MGRTPPTYKENFPLKKYFFLKLKFKLWGFDKRPLGVFPLVLYKVVSFFFSVAKDLTNSCTDTVLLCNVASNRSREGFKHFGRIHLNPLNKKRNGYPPKKNNFLLLLNLVADSVLYKKTGMEGNNNPNLPENYPFYNFIWWYANFNYWEWYAKNTNNFKLNAKSSILI